MSIKLGDFGLAVKLKNKEEKRYTVCGTPNYIAPEILNEECGYQYSADVWSLGVILYVLTIGKPPFESLNTDTLYQKIKCGLYRFPDDRKLSLEFKQLIRSIFVVDPGKRITAEEMIKSDYFMKSVIPRKLPSFTKLFCPDDEKIQEILLQGVVDMNELAKELEDFKNDNSLDNESANGEQNEKEDSKNDKKGEFVDFL
jgi:serine/threonine protein kinase